MRFRVLLAGIALAFTAALPLAALHPNHPLGISSDRSYQSNPGEIDHIDLFSGSLSLTIPVGPFTLNYSSNVWRYSNDSTGAVVATPDRENNAGLGWHLGWGEVYSPSHWYNTSGQWMYVGEDGGRHFFHSTLHRGETPETDVFYTRDNTYLRMRKINNQGVEIDFPDGSTRRFSCIPAPGNGCGLGSTFRLRKVWSPFGSFNDPDLEVTYGDFNGFGSPELWSVTDRYGRTHHIRLDGSGPFINLRITQVDVEGFAGQRARYDFHYLTRNIDVSCKDTSSTTNPRIAIPLLARVDMPNGSSYRMTDAGGANPYYFDTCWNNIDDVSGVLRAVHLPTGGQIAWGWQEYEFPPGGTNSPFNTSAGVHQRVVVDSDVNILGTWTYKTDFFGGGSSTAPADDPRVETQVVYPTGDCTKHYFNARYYQHPSLGRGWEYGLPFDYRQSSGGKYRSTEVYESNDGNGACAGDPLRTSYVKYRRDATPGSGSAPASEWYQTNRTMSGSRTVFHDDGNRYVDTERSEFDGLGHFRRVVSTGNLWDGSSNQERRETFTGFDAVSGTYPGSFTPLPSSAPWLLETFDHIQVTENDAVGESVKRTEYGFETGTGFLFCSRTLRSGATRDSRDVLTINERNARGQVTDVKIYGGDLQPLSTAGGACGNVPSSPVSWTTHTYQFGEKTTSVQREANGAFAPFLIFDVDRDPSTGLITVSRDTAGAETRYTYDPMGRRTSADHDQEGFQTVDYIPATSTSGVLIRTSVREFAGGPILAQTEVELDALGRTHRQARLLPGGVWSEQFSEYNARGWLTSISEWGDPSRKTTYREYDPFGRPGSVRPPEGAVHDIEFDYSGIRQVVHRTSVAQPGGAAMVATTQQSDRYGRLRRSMEPSGPSGNTTTSYFYDVGKRLTEIRSGTSPQQTRRYVYDNRGFLVRETHPEKGAGGNGSVQYLNHDALGRVHRQLDGPRDLRYTYDPFGRTTEVRDGANGNRLITRFEYDSALGSGLGKLHYAERHNWVDLPWTTTAADENVPVIETFEYEGPGGRLSRKALQIQTLGQDYNFSHVYEYDGVGNLSRLGNVDYVYEAGLLTAVPGWVSDIQYHSSGVWSRIDHTNGTSDHQEIDPNARQRTKRRYTQGPTGLVFNSGNLVYDGTGNIQSMGLDTFAYDGVGRLVDATVGNYRQTYTYDSFGNQTSVATTDPTGALSVRVISVDSATNRESAGWIDYDAAGNQTRSGSALFSWDPLGELKQAGDVAYLYNASSERVATLFKDTDPTRRWIRFTDRDITHRVLSEFVLRNDNWRTKRYVYAEGRLIASDDSTNGVRHYHLDHLDSVRRTTNAQGLDPVAQDFLPFGEETTPGNTGEIFRFGSHERDTPFRTYMHARSYLVKKARFMSVDPERGDPRSPQSLNRYAYALGNPLKYADPDGRRAKNIEDSGFRDAVREHAVDFLLGHDHPLVASTGQIIDGITTIAGGLGKIASGLGLILGSSGPWLWLTIPAGAFLIADGFSDVYNGTRQIDEGLREMEREIGNSPGIPGVPNFFIPLMSGPGGGVLMSSTTVTGEDPGKTSICDSSGQYCLETEEQLSPKAVEELQESLQKEIDRLELEAHLNYSVHSLRDFGCQMSFGAACSLGIGGGGSFCDASEGYCVAQLY